jgi:hypothetical protein
MRTRARRALLDLRKRRHVGRETKGAPEPAPPFDGSSIDMESRTSANDGISAKNVLNAAHCAAGHGACASNSPSDANIT